MPIRSTPPITMQQILDEFAAPQATPLSAMLKGGYYVPSDVAGGTIPTALPLDMSDFLGATRPASISIDSVQALSGTVSSTINGLTTSINLTHASVGPKNTTAFSSATARVNFKLMHATTPRVRLAARANSPIVGGLYYRLYSSASRPQFDNGVASDSGGGPGVSDVLGSKQGSWSITPPLTNVLADESHRIVQSLVLSNAAVDNATVSADFAVLHTIHAYIDTLQFNESFSHSAGGGRATFNLALLFLNESDQIVQEVPVSITIATFGQLSAFATAFLP